MTIEQEILTKVATILNYKIPDATDELLDDVTRILDYCNDKTNFDHFTDDINKHLGDNTSFSTHFLKSIYDLPPEDLTFIFLCYFKWK